MRRTVKLISPYVATLGLLQASNVIGPASATDLTAYITGQHLFLPIKLLTIHTGCPGRPRNQLDTHRPCLFHQWSGVHTGNRNCWRRDDLRRSSVHCRPENVRPPRGQGRRVHSLMLQFSITVTPHNLPAPQMVRDSPVPSDN